ncbi:MAG TPA: carboxypeptidase-like regulatory domain-containing protein, partial [Nitrososphaera sp.]|nr:carboxypeptidase-like regulatory domain-containing protein [Nitrososphaera sp.]
MQTLNGLASLFFTDIKSDFRKGLVHVTFVLLISNLSTAMLVGQSYYGGLRGSVRDPNAAVVPNAKVSVVDQNTGITRVTRSGPDGEYVFNQVIPATYTVLAEVTGFKKFERKDVIISTQEQVNLDLTL